MLYPKLLASFVLVLMFCHAYAQKESSLTIDGMTLPKIPLASTGDTATLGKVKAGQLIYNTNASIYGSGASGTGIYTWQSNVWRKVNSTMPVGAIISSQTKTNPILEQKGFIYFSSISMDSDTLHLFQKR
jgi:hypothetical protein